VSQRREKAKRRWFLWDRLAGSDAIETIRDYPVELSSFDIAFFFAFSVAVAGFAMYKSRREKTSENYFLASRGLTWPLIGVSIVAANISTEQRVGMAGQGAGTVGLAVGAWQLTRSVGIVIIAFTLLPRFRSGKLEACDGAGSAGHHRCWGPRCRVLVTPGLGNSLSDFRACH